jgi:hypothetical protein
VRVPVPVPGLSRLTLGVWSGMGTGKGTGTDSEGFFLAALRPLTSLPRVVTPASRRTSRDPTY